MKWNKKTWILDGAMGTVLQNKGLEVGEIPEELSITKPNIIYEVHREYLASGAEIIYTNTFGANKHKLKDSTYTLHDILKSSISIAKAAAEDKALIGLSIGPIGQLLEPNGTLSFEDAYKIFKEIIDIGTKEDVDIIIFETLTDIYEAKAGVLAAKENSNLPIFVTMSLEKDGRTFLGSSLREIVPVLEGLGVDALGINCSLGPKEIEKHALELCAITNLPIIIKPNAGLPDPITKKYNSNPEEFVETLTRLYENGVAMFGGCCGSDSSYISLLAKNLKNKPIIKKEIKKESIVSSSTRSISIDEKQVVVIGERISPTGKELLQDAIKNKNINYILKEVLNQVEEGAEIINFSIALPNFDDSELMPDLVKAIQSVTDTPLQIDTTNPVAMEAGIRVYNGKPIVNSVTGKPESLAAILPIVKKYGASVVALTIDENGIPKTAEERLEVAKNILNTALSYGIKKEDIFIDTLTLTASAQQEDVFETLKAIRLVKKELGMKTLLGVSNISFGLPNRLLLNKSFLAMALYDGLNLPIINTGDPEMMNQIYAFKVLSNIDKGSKEYINFFGTKENYQPTKTLSKKNTPLTLKEGIIKGSNIDAIDSTKELLKNTNELDIIDNHIIVALDEVGKKFESGEIFLPQLLQSASAAQESFNLIKNKLIKEGKKSKSKGKILLATVKGDVHDIGKNIVKIILENYGYEVIDLGKDVEIEKIVTTAIDNKIKLVGLSSLMTTTLKNMEHTIKSLHESNVDCKIVVGGAVVTKEYAEFIKADYYAKDAKAAIDIARIIFK